MKITLLLIGKTSDEYLKEGVERYTRRIKRYVPFEVDIIPEPKATKKLNVDLQKDREGELIIDKLKSSAKIILLDEKGKEYPSMAFAKLIEKEQLSSTKHITFIIGGAYGFSKKVYEIANMKLSLSKMTFSHQLVRVVFLEQLYRAFTIIKGEPYHHN